MKWIVPALLAAALTVASLCGHVLASMPENMDLSSMVQESEVIVKGKVKETRAKWIDDERGKHIYTTVVIKIDTLLKGTPWGDEFTFEVVGGTVGDITEVVSDSARFVKDEEVILFLKGYPLRIVGGRHGKISVYEGKVRIKKYLIPVNQLIQSLEKLNENPTADISFDEILKTVPKGGVQPPTDHGGGQIPPNKTPKEPLKESEESQKSQLPSMEMRKFSEPSKGPMSSSEEKSTE